ncbi:MAG: 4Fe-4S binding protein [Lachnospiraceae bacterium]|nr:4Fe-4S binding protein [Lachnospiraceae bacterium]
MNSEKAYIRPEKCVGCGACIAVCPQHAIRMKAGWKSEVDAGKCIGCGSCAAICHRGVPVLIKSAE